MLEAKGGKQKVTKGEGLTPSIWFFSRRSGREVGLGFGSIGTRNSAMAEAHRACSCSNVFPLPMCRDSFVRRSSAPRTFLTHKTMPHCSSDERSNSYLLLSLHIFRIPEFLTFKCICFATNHCWHLKAWFSLSFSCIVTLQPADIRVRVRLSIINLL